MESQISTQIEKLGSMKFTRRCTTCGNEPNLFAQKQWMDEKLKQINATKFLDINYNLGNGQQVREGGGVLKGALKIGGG